VPEADQSPPPAPRLRMSGRMPPLLRAPLSDVDYLNTVLCLMLGPVYVVGIATRYQFDGRKIESRLGGEIFRTHPERSCAPTILLFPKGKAVGAWSCPPTPSKCQG
jgi:hypothetical protein